MRSYEITATDERFRLLWYLSGDSKSISPFFFLEAFVCISARKFVQQAVMKCKLSMSVKMSQFRHTCYLPFFAAHIILVMMIPILHYNECFKTMPTRFSCQMSMEPEPNIKYCDYKWINCRLFCCNLYIYYFSKKMKIINLLYTLHLNTFENSSKLIKWNENTLSGV